MWEVWEHRRVGRQLDQLPVDVLKRYENWKDIVEISGPQGLRLIKGFHDDALKSQWKGHRSSRLSLKYRVVYRIEGKRLVVEVVRVSTHDNKRKGR
jgi:addiction module RelE/StbE family toxin